MPWTILTWHHSTHDYLFQYIFYHPKAHVCFVMHVQGSEMDEDELVSPSEDSNDSWTTAEEYSSEFILRYGVK